MPSLVQDMRVNHSRADTLSVSHEKQVAKIVV